MPKYVIYGAGAIGGVAGARLFQHGIDVTLIARGPHYEAIRDSGLRIRDPESDDVIKVPIVNHPSNIVWTGDEIVLMTMKSQHTAAAVTDLATFAPYATRVVAVQNGVSGESDIARFFPHVYGACVASPTTFLEPGIVQAHSFPVTGLLDFGRYPFGTDDTTREIAEAFSQSTYDSRQIDDLMSWKWRKLLTNLSNAIEVVCGSGTRTSFIADFARAEATVILDAAGITYRSEQDDKDRRGDLLQFREIGGRPRPGGSTWQSIARSAGSIETSYLNGQIAVVGRANDVPTPVNSLLVRMCEVQNSVNGAAPQATIEEFLTLLAATGGDLPDAIQAQIESDAASLRPEVDKFWTDHLGASVPAEPTSSSRHR